MAIKQYGLIGKHLQHSFSPSYFARKFAREGIDNARYDLFELPSIEQLLALLQEDRGWGGLNVTIPYKEAVIPYLNRLDPIAESVGAVNTIAFENGQLVGYNTDVIGFRDALIAQKHPMQQALILGSGGAAKAVAYALDQLGVKHQVVSRQGRLSYAQLDAEMLQSVELIVNTTPLGMHPAIEAIPPIPIHALGQQHLVYDLIYNPMETLLLARAKAKAAKVLNGLAMLEGQAEAAWAIWNQGHSPST